MTATNEVQPRRRGAAIVIGGAVGAVVGFIVGFAVAGSLWLWAFAQSLDGAAFRIPGIVTVGSSGGESSAEVGPLLIAMPLIVAALVAGLAVLVLAVRRPRAASPALP